MEINLELIKVFAIPGVMTLVLGWFGKRYLDRKLESEKAINQKIIKEIENNFNQYLEVHKQRIKNSEFFFEKQYDASQDLYKLKREMMPPYTHPDMDWHEALQEMANSLNNTHTSLREFLNKYFTVLSPDVLEKLESAASNAEEGLLFGSGDDIREPGMQCTEHTYNLVKECSSHLKSEVDGQRLVEFKEYEKKNS